MNLICTQCPRGCRLTVEEGRVEGNACPRGRDFGLQEAQAPMREVSSTVAVSGGVHPVCPVKTAAPVPKHLQKEVVRALQALTVPAPLSVGQKVLENVCGTGVAVIATRAMAKKEQSSQ